MNRLVHQIATDVETLPVHLQEEILGCVQFLKLKCQKKYFHSVVEDSESDEGKVVGLMEKIAACGAAFQDVEDPLEWQKEIRKNRNVKDSKWIDELKVIDPFKGVEA